MSTGYLDTLRIIHEFRLIADIASINFRKLRAFMYYKQGQWICIF